MCVVVLHVWSHTDWTLLLCMFWMFVLGELCHIYWVEADWQFHMNPQGYGGICCHQFSKLFQVLLTQVLHINTLSKRRVFQEWRLLILFTPTESCAVRISPDLLVFDPTSSTHCYECRALPWSPKSLWGPWTLWVFWGFKQNLNKTTGLWMF